MLEAIPNERLVYAWNGGHTGNIGYGSSLRTVVTLTLTKVTGGTQRRMVHSGFELPRNGNRLHQYEQRLGRPMRNLDRIAAEQAREDAALTQVDRGEFLNPQEVRADIEKTNGNGAMHTPPIVSPQA